MQFDGPLQRQDPGIVTAMIDNRSGLSDELVRQTVQDRWVEMAGLQFAHPSNFQLYSQAGQGSMLARTPFRTPRDVIEEIKLARSVADTDDDVGGIIGQMIAIAFGEGVTNQHRDETTLEFFNQIAAPTGMNLEAVLGEMYRELLIAGSVTTITLFTRKRMQYFPLKSDVPVAAQLQFPNVGILPAENIRVISNDVLGNGELAYWVENQDMKQWLDEYFSPTTSPGRKAIMTMQEPVAASVFTGRIQVPYNDGDPASRGLTLFTLNPRMVHRSSHPKGASPYARPLLTRNFALLEAKRLLNIMDYALLQGGTNYIVVAKKGSDEMPAQQVEIDNLINQVTHASRSGVMVGDHRLSIEIITPKLDELLSTPKRKLLGRKIKMGLMRQSEEVSADSGTQGAANEMELTGRVISYDRRLLVRHAQSTFYDETATRNRVAFSEGAPSIWAPKIILAGVKDFWSNLLQARDRGDIPRRYVVEALGFDYDAALAEREREIKRGDDEILMPASVPFSNPGEPQDNGPGRPVGSGSNNGRGKDGAPSRKDPYAPNRVIQRNAGETIKALVEGTEVFFVGETTMSLLDNFGADMDFSSYVVDAEREAINFNQTVRSSSSVIVPVNAGLRVTDMAAVKLGESLKMIVGRQIGDGALVAKALRFYEPDYDLHKASEYALRWGFITEPLTETAATKKKRCVNCGNELPSYSSMNPVCPSCGTDNTPGSGPQPDMAEIVRSELSTLAIPSLDDIVARVIAGLPPTPPPALPPAPVTVDEWGGVGEPPSQPEREAFQTKHGKDSGVSLKKDAGGRFFVHTHRARSKSYEKPDGIPKEEVEAISATG